VLQREKIIEELWSRLADVAGVQYTARNPKAPPSIENLPAIQFFELGDTVVNSSMRGGYPIYSRVVSVVIEAFIKGSSETAVGKELMDFMVEIKKQLYLTGTKMRSGAVIQEVSSSRVLRPPVGANVAGIGLAVELRYVEDVGTIMS